MPSAMQAPLRLGQTQQKPLLKATTAATLTDFDTVTLHQHGIPVETLAKSQKDLTLRVEPGDNGAFRVFGKNPASGEEEQLGKIVRPEGLPKSFRIVQAKAGDVTGVFQSEQDPKVSYFLTPGSQAKFATGAEVTMCKLAKEPNYILKVAGAKPDPGRGADRKPLNATVMLLGAGLSSRFYPFTPAVGSKIAAPIQPGVTVPGAAMNELHQQGASDFVTNLHFKAEQSLHGIEKSFEHIGLHDVDPKEPANLYYIHEKQLGGTAGGLVSVLSQDDDPKAPPLHTAPMMNMDGAEAVKSIRDFKQRLNTRPVLLLQGDAVIDGIDFHKLLDAHAKAKKEYGALVTMVALKPENPKLLHQFGCMKTETPNSSSRITQFIEKPKDLSVLNDEDPNKPAHHLMNTGIYVIDPDVFPILKASAKMPTKDKGVFDFGNDFFPYLVKNNIPIHAEVMAGQWSDVGNLHAYMANLSARQEAIQHKSKDNPFSQLGNLMMAGADGKESVAVTPEARRAFKLDQRDGTAVAGNVLVARHLPDAPYGDSRFRLPF